MTTASSARVRMYRIGELGDCFLLTFTAADAQSNMLIDCGSFRNGARSVGRLKEIAAHIAKELNGKPLDVVVGTHQHNDHVNGFVHCESAFRKMGVGEVWLPWLDDPRDKAATGICKTHANLKRALYGASERLRRLSLGAKGARAQEVLGDILGFYGAAEGNGGAKSAPELPANAIAILRKLGRKKPQYLRPGRVLDVPGVPAGTVRAYVLGPPKDTDLLYRKDPRSDEAYDPALTATALTAGRFLAALGNPPGELSPDEDEYPFSEHFKQRDGRRGSRALRQLQDSYEAADAQWRRIDDDWTEQASSLAIFLDAFTNNSSLVLAIELVESGKVLLFAADAQTGNWLSWNEVKWERPGVTTDDLLARTVLYKVGHHASHNATLVAALEKMSNPDLTALIPVDKKDPNIAKQNGWRMPARLLFRRLAEKTSHRVLQMDGVNPASCDPEESAVKASWKKIGVQPKVTDLYVEVEIRADQR